MYILRGAFSHADPFQRIKTASYKALVGEGEAEIEEDNEMDGLRDGEDDIDEDGEVEIEVLMDGEVDTDVLMLEDGDVEILPPVGLGEDEILDEIEILELLEMLVDMEGEAEILIDGLELIEVLSDVDGDELMLVLMLGELDIDVLIE